jgi:DNA invertase Pin-like site-specific DNA recombinase
LVARFVRDEEAVGSNPATPTRKTGFSPPATRAVLPEGIDTSNATGRMVAGVLASLAELELELELGRQCRSAAREARRARGQSIGRPRVLDGAKAALAQRICANGEPATTIAQALGVSVSCATEYRVLAVGDDDT